MSNFINDIIKNANDQIKYKETVVTGEVTADNGDGTYDVKIANAPTAYPNVLTATYGDTFSVGEIAIITFEYGNKEMPRLWGHAKKIKQTPKVVEVDYSGKTGGGQQTVEVTIYRDLLAYIVATDSDYDKAHDSVDGSDISEIESDNGMIIGQEYAPTGDGHIIYRTYITFDTSSIPEDATITEATLQIKYFSSTVETVFYIVIQDGQPNYPHNPVINADYYYANYRNNGGQFKVDLGEADPSILVTITLTSNGQNWINKGGITQFCLRSSNDIAIKNLTNGEQNFIENDDEFEPKLTITYTI